MPRSSLARHVPSGVDPAQQSATRRMLLQRLASELGVVPIDLKLVRDNRARDVIQREAERQGISLGGKARQC